MTSAVLETVVGWGLVSTLILAPVAIAAWLIVRGEE